MAKAIDGTNNSIPNPQKVSPTPSTKIKVGILEGITKKEAIAEKKPVTVSVNAIMKKHNISIPHTNITVNSTAKSESASGKPIGSAKIAISVIHSAFNERFGLFCPEAI